MIEHLSGILLSSTETAAVVDVHGVGLRITLSGRALDALPRPGERIELYTHLHVKEDALDLYGFANEQELRFFELLISISGVGPKSALSVLGVGELSDLAAAIAENRPDLLTQASGVGRRTAERIIVELRTKIHPPSSDVAIRRMDVDADLVETLAGLGYRREEAKAALGKLDAGITTLEGRLKAVLGALSRKKSAHQ